MPSNPRCFMRVSNFARPLLRRISVRGLGGLLVGLLLWGALGPPRCGAQPNVRGSAPTIAEIENVMRRAAQFYHGEVAVGGGYVYYYAPDVSWRHGEGIASATQVWVQPPGTPTVAIAYAIAYEATGDDRYLRFARDAAKALLYGRLASGGWSNAIDVQPMLDGQRFEGGNRPRDSHSSLDDDQTTAAIEALMRVDDAGGQQDEAIHAAALQALDALLAAQFPSGGFPQVWTGPVDPRPIRQARYPDHDWKTEGRIKEYWDEYTLNDNVCGNVARVLQRAHETYGDPRYINALRKLGDFLILAQMPEPQCGWCQQYNAAMEPIWARKFEPPAVAGDETQETIRTLIRIGQVTGDRKYLEPIEPALVYLERSELPDGRLARYYELKTNKPLYMERSGNRYRLTYSDARLPSHYGWKWPSEAESLRRIYQQLRDEGTLPRPAGVTLAEVREIIDGLDPQGRWLVRFQGQPLVGQPKFKPGQPFLSSQVFANNLTVLSRYLQQRQAGVW